MELRAREANLIGKKEWRALENVFFPLGIDSHYFLDRWTCINWDGMTCGHRHMYADSKCPIASESEGTERVHLLGKDETLRAISEEQNYRLNSILRRFWDSKWAEIHPEKA